MPHGAILDIVARHKLIVIEDCARTGRDMEGRPVGTLGDAGFFSFQTPAAQLLRRRAGARPDAAVAACSCARRGRTVARRKRVTNRLLVGCLQRIFIRPWVFTISAFPILWVSSLIGANLDVYLWEDIRSLDPLPEATPSGSPTCRPPSAWPRWMR